MEISYEKEHINNKKGNSVMGYYCNPLNLPYRYQMVDHSRPGQPSQPLHIYREAADPSMVLFRGIYYMFPSMTAGFFTSEDMAEWVFHPFLSGMPIYDYAPDVRVVGEYLYFSASKRGTPCSFYRTKDPLKEPFEEIKGSFEFWDPNMFCDDDGRVYFYWGCSNMTPIYGVELDPDTLLQKGKPEEVIHGDHTCFGYERIGNDHICPKTKEEIEAQVEAMIEQFMQVPQEAREHSGLGSEEAVRAIAYSLAGDAPYIEGAWMTKHNGKYYLQYAAPGTQYNIYADAVYISDNPLGPFKPAKNNPYSYKPGGFMNGAGHGSTMKDQDGAWWHTSTMSISCNDDMERRVGLWKAGFDADGELFCDQRYGDWVLRTDAKPFEKPEWMLLSYGKQVEVSSGTGKENITDENCRTWWSAAGTESGEWAVVDLGQQKDIRAVQINFMDEGIEADFPADNDAQITYEKRYIDRALHYTRWTLEGSTDNENWTVISDKSDVQTDLSNDFLLWQAGISYRYLKLTVKEMPFGQPACISGIRVFGKSEGDLPDKTENVVTERRGELDLSVSWNPDSAVGHNILWGYAADKLYHSYMVFGKHSQNIGAVIKGQEMYIRVDAFNENGITEGDIIKV